MIDTRTAPHAALLLRVSLGVLLCPFDLWRPRDRRVLPKHRYPGFFAYLVMLGEIGGGIVLILGLWTR